MKKIIKELSVGLLVISPMMALAQTGYLPPSGTLGMLIEKFINYAIGLIIAIAVFYILWGAFKFLTGGSSGDVSEGRNTVIYALVAVGIALLARILVNIVVEIVRF